MSDAPTTLSIHSLHDRLRSLLSIPTIRNGPCTTATLSYPYLLPSRGSCPRHSRDEERAGRADAGTFRTGNRRTRFPGDGTPSRTGPTSDHAGCGTIDAWLDH